MGLIASNARSGPIPLPPGGRVVWERGEAFSLWIWVRWEVSWFFVGGLRCGSSDGVTCRGGLCGIGPALAGKLGGGSAFALRAVFLWIASNARSGPIPRPPTGGVVWERGEAFSLWIRFFFRGFWVSGGGVRCGSGDGVTCRGGLCGIGPALAEGKTLKKSKRLTELSTR